MSDRPPMEGWEARVHTVAQAFAYPPTPTITPTVVAVVRPHPRSAIRLGRRAWAVAVLVVLLLLLWSVPQVRAGVRAILRIGAVEIVLPTPAPQRSPSPSPTAHQPTAGMTVLPTPPLNTTLSELAGSTTLTDARRQVTFPIRLPRYPSDLGVPDRVFVQDLAGTAVILVWLEPSHPERVRLSLHLLSSDLLMRKSMVKELTQTTVNGQPAAWVTGPHLIEIRTASGGRTIDQRQLVDGNTLIWTAGTLTYRLETHQSLSEAVRTAESLH
ncbi:MAG: hypothetical protein H0X37_02580 [Herpetosiphonaceae bacterium]|nr:hypothetical protein [Herpetosiphonaceae bacterium]